MGVVVAAYHLQLDERVALKLLLPHARESAASVARFAREARAAAKIKSEHVARVIDVGEIAPGSPYIVMEYLEGRDLAAELAASGPLPIAEAVSCVLQACEALAEAHALGIVHRDLKPANLFLAQRPSGRPIVKVLDFGISKASLSDAASALTHTSAMMGSPAYMSPEQLSSSKHVDARSDIWALGATLYELLSGVVPFRAEGVAQLVGAIMEGELRPLDQVRPDVPIDLARAVARCLAKSPEARFADVGELGGALTPFGPPQSDVSVQRISHVLSLARGQALLPPTKREDGGAVIEGPEPGVSVDARTVAGVAPTSHPLRGYRIVRELGRGGTATTHEAVRDSDGQVVALKRLSIAAASDWKRVDLFQREAAVLARLDHPGIPRYIENFTVEGGAGGPSLYLAQELVRGKPLSEAGVLGEDEARRVATELLDILAYLERQTPPVVHRDLKPANLIRRPDGTIAVVDFGAVRADVTTPEGGTTTVGTYGYMAPEQLHGVATPATDLYGLACTLLFLLTGRSPSELPRQKLRIDVAKSVDARVSQGFVRWLETTLEPAAEDRFPSVAAAKDALLHPDRARLHRSSPAIRWLVWGPLTLLSVVALVAALAVAFRPARPLALPNPPGSSYRQTCAACSYASETSALNCACRTVAGAMRPTTLNLSVCEPASPIHNIAGHLMCGNHRGN
ncbi:MAG: protein kinase domain-containing protein, partial [Polyangiaceae bacterium]